MECGKARALREGFVAIVTQLLAINWFSIRAAVHLLERSHRLIAPWSIGL
jgi:hypothetical protein